MKPADLIASALADGVTLRLIGEIVKVGGDREARGRWLPAIRDHKDEIISALKVGAGDTAPDPMTADEETAIRAWLALIEETDPATIAEVISQCQRDAEARDYFTERAAAELPTPEQRRQAPTAMLIHSGVNSIF